MPLCFSVRCSRRHLNWKEAENPSRLGGDCISGPIWDKPESWSDRDLDTHSLWGACVKHLNSVFFPFLLCFLGWLSCVDLPWRKGCPPLAKLCHGSLLHGSDVKLKWRPSAMNVLCQVSLNTSVHISIFRCAGLYPLPWRESGMAVPLVILIQCFVFSNWNWEE